MCNSTLEYGCKHPVLLRAHPLVNLIVQHHHRMTLQGGLKLTLVSLRQEVWIPRARLVRAAINHCLRCAQEKAAVPAQLMGYLPSVRINQVSRAFTHTGVDYAGPIAVRTAPGRGHKSHKAYIALFVCMTVKAIHLELVSDYSTAAFIAAYHRFTARRGLPTAMYSEPSSTALTGSFGRCSPGLFGKVTFNFNCRRLKSSGFSFHPTLLTLGGCRKPESKA